MWRYILKRVLLVIPVLIGVSFLIFAIMNFTPGDPVVNILGPEAPEEAKEALRKELHLDDPFLVRYVRYMGDAIQGDFGHSYRTNLPVFDEILQRFPTTFKLAVLSITLATLIGLPLGIMSALKQYSLTDNVFSILAMLFASVPTFWLGLMLVLVFSLQLDWFPSYGVESAAAFVLPTVALACPTAAQILRLTRSSLLEVIRQDYIRTARAKGLAENKTVMRHAIKNALLPVITVIGMHFGTLMGGTVVTETIFGIPGLGALVVTEVKNKNIPQVMAVILFISTLFCLIMLIVDLVYAFIDPRIKAKYIRYKGGKV